jgi:hypothetical protein
MLLGQSYLLEDVETAVTVTFADFGSIPGSEVGARGGGERVNEAGNGHFG